MNNQPRIKKGFYKGYLEDKNQVEEPAPPKDQIVIINKKERDGFLKVLLNALGAVFRFIVYIVVFGLSSVGLTAILNENICRLLLKMLE